MYSCLWPAIKLTSKTVAVIRCIMWLSLSRAAAKQY